MVCKTGATLIPIRLFPLQRAEGAHLSTGRWDMRATCPHRDRTWHLERWAFMVARRSNVTPAFLGNLMSACGSDLLLRLVPGSLYTQCPYGTHSQRLLCSRSVWCSLSWKHGQSQLFVVRKTHMLPVARHTKRNGNGGRPCLWAVLRRTGAYLCPVLPHVRIFRPF